MVRILLISGSCPPMRCGVGDYTASLASALHATRRANVALLVGKGDVTDLEGVELLRGGWEPSSAWSMLRTVFKWKPDVIHMQFPTQGYSFYALPWIFPMLLRIAGFPVVQTLHEFLPMASHWRSHALCLAGTSYIVVRPNYLRQIPAWYRWLLRNSRIDFIPNASSVPKSNLSKDELARLHGELLRGQKRLIVYFGFANSNKGVDALFEIADFRQDQLVLLCDLSSLDAYQETILAKCLKAPWREKVTVTGFLPASRAADILAVADAVVLPFPGGGGVWNSSVHAAAEQGTLVITTSVSQHGYNASENIFYAAPGDVESMAAALSRYSGKKKPEAGSDKANWAAIAEKHLKLYGEITRGN